jgi:hypothetical protein
LLALTLASMLMLVSTLAQPLTSVLASMMLVSKGTGTAADVGAAIEVGDNVDAAVGWHWH